MRGEVSHECVYSILIGHHPDCCVLVELSQEVKLRQFSSMYESSIYEVASKVASMEYDITGNVME